MALSAEVRERIERLRLAAHPEGGFYREVFRSPLQVEPGDGRGARAALTVIHFLLPAGAHSRWHSVRSDEQWTFLDGEPLELLVLAPSAHAVTRVRLGPLERGCVPTFVVPADAWQAARPTGSFALTTCTVGPGFDFADFRMVAELSHARARLGSVEAGLADLL
jgi:predicted cupin superfamily sugar epimerase